ASASRIPSRVERTVREIREIWISASMGSMRSIALTLADLSGRRAHHFSGRQIPHYPQGRCNYHSSIVSDLKGIEMEETILQQVRDTYRALRSQMKQKFNRHVSFGDLFTDRWETSRHYGFGEGTSCYDNVLILGSVVVGRHTWIGPNVIL